MKTATAGKPAEPKIAIDRQANTITLWRRFSAAPQKVFTAWTRPEHVSAWWDPAGRPLARCEIDLKVGGRFTFVNEGHPDMPFTGVYREIDPPGLIAFEANGTLGRVSLKARDGGTLMTVTIACGSAGQLETYLKLGIDVGTGRTMDNLVAHVEGTGA
jgi:uncharacterized protein YndB with AHSA1/START domain